MTRNVGNIDRALRAVLGLVLLAWAIFGSLTGVMLYAAIAVGIVMLATSSMRLCPLYSIVGIKTCKEC